ncbi:MAG: hypothetical protein ACI9O4_001879 [Chitinophagales bacterium]|jgi:hypothetical protein
MRTTKMSLLMILGILLLTFSSCEKEDNNPPADPPSADHKFEVGASTTASVFGNVIDENGNAVSGAAVSLGASSTITDANGVFFIENASAYEKHAYVTVEKSGFFLGSRAFVPGNDVDNVKIMLLAKQNIGSFDAASGGTVFGNGITIEFQEGVVDASGASYTGVVQVAAKYIDPESEDFFDYMPGNLIGADDNGGNYLKSKGMIAAELTDGAGNELQPASGSDATVSFPLSAGLLSDAPASIDLWHFDEDAGYWILEGEATLQGSTYVATVSHFSFWNCDIPTSYVILDGQIVDASLAGVAGVTVRVVSTSWGTGTANTDAGGFYSGIVPAGDPLTLEIYMNCGAGPVLLSTFSLGSLISDLTASPIAVSGYTAVSGDVVDCSSSPVANGYISYGDGYVSYLSGGVFTFNACDGSTVDVQAFDIDALTESGLVSSTVSGVSFGLGTIMACSSINDFISWTINGDDYLATNNVNMWEQGSYAGISGDTPNSFEFNSTSFTGVGSYVIDGSGMNYMYAESLASIISGSINVNITSYGPSSGDLIEGDFLGSITGTSPIDSSSVTQAVNGIIHFYRD